MKKKVDSKVKTVGEHETFINLLRVACDDQNVNDTLEKLLSLPDDRRKAMLHSWVSELVINNAPKDFVHAIACLLDDRVAEKAYEVIFQCQRKPMLPRFFKHD